MRSNPQIMIKGKAAHFFIHKKDTTILGDTEPNTVKIKKMSEEELRVLDELQFRDSAVREEEETHARMLGRHAGAIRYEYQIGPDGRAYVINGSVEVNPKFNSTNPEDIRKVLQTIQRAAVSVSNPSQADLNIAASAASKASILSHRAAITKYTQGVESQLSSTHSSISANLVNNQLNTQA